MTDRILAVGEETFPAPHINANSITATSGIMRVSCFTARKSEKIGQLRVVSGGAVQSGATLIRLGVYMISGAAGTYTAHLVANTENDLTIFTATSTEYTRTLTAPFWKSAGQIYGLAVLVVGGTAPTLLGVQSQSAAGGSMLLDPPASLLETGLTDMPNNMTLNRGNASIPYGVILP